jgi:hypothetical protein
MSRKTDRFIVRPRIREELIHHDIDRAKQQIGLSYNYMDSSLVPEADIHVGLQEVKQVPPDFKPFIKPHKHDVSQFYGIVGDLSIEVTLEDERHEVNGPASIFIPAGMIHSFCPLRGSGYIIIVLGKEKYE